MSIKYEQNTISWVNIMHLGHSFQIYLLSKFIPAAENFTFQGDKYSYGQTFWNLDFLPENSRLYIYYQNKNRLGFTSSSCINLTMKLLIKVENSPKSRVKTKFYIFGKPYLSFPSDRLFIFSDFIVLQGMMEINQKSKFKFILKNP